MLKKIIIFLIFALTIFSTAYGAEVSLVLDTPNIKKLPRNFRTSWQPMPANSHASLLGFADLHMLGSAQFSELELKEVLTKLKQPVIIVDLRQESHGYLNGNAISWYGEHDWANVGKSNAQIHREETQDLAKLANEKTVVLRKTINDGEGVIITNQAALSLIPKSELTEAQLAKKIGLGYERIYVTDRRAPVPAEVDRFVNFVKTIKPNKTLYFHCREGVGRTTTFMIMYDMLHNAKNLSYDDIIKRNKALGFNNIFDLPPQNNFKHPYAVARLNFLRQFYDYAAANKDNFKTSWSEWLAKSNLSEGSSLDISEGSSLDI